MARNAGYMPMLYTDADYAASNVCYAKIGYVLKGKETLWKIPFPKGIV